MSSQRYIPIKPLASGGMADVWLGVQVSETGFSRLCAIKKIKDIGENQEKEFISMFRDEAMICQSLQHANIVQVYDFTELQNGYALIMEYIQGVNLAQLLRMHRENGEPLPLDISLFLAQEIAKGLHYVHTRKDPLTDEPLGIVHRDISPSNILLSSEGEVKITDFGIAKAKANSHETQVGVVKGKFQYMSPEQVQGANIDNRTDLFAMAIVIWECLAGRRLYESDSDAQLIQMVVQREAYPDLRKINPDVDDHLLAIIHKTMHPDINKRTQSANEFSTLVSEYMKAKEIACTAFNLAQYIAEQMPNQIAASKELVRFVANEAENLQRKQATTPPAPERKSNETPVELSIPSTNEAESLSSLALPTREKSVNLHLSPGSISFNSNTNTDTPTTNLQWGQTQEQASINFRRRTKRRKFSPTFVSFLTFSTAVLVVVLISAGIAQYALKIDVIGKASQFNAKLRKDLKFGRP